MDTRGIHRDVPATRAPGEPAGIEGLADRHHAPPLEAVSIRCTDYGPDSVNTLTVVDLDAFLAEPRPAWSEVRWICVEGLNPHVVDRFRSAFDLHTLAAEDVVDVPQRPKCDVYDDHVFVVATMIRRDREILVPEQVSFFLKASLLISFQERQDDIWKRILARINDRSSRLRGHGADYLLYALLDAIVDHYFPLVEKSGDRLEELEDDIIEQSSADLLGSLHGVKRDLLVLRHAIWPMRQLVDDLSRQEEERVTEITRTFLRDVHAHTVMIMDVIETYRELGASLTELYVSSLSNRMTEIMKVLTIIATLFIPLTFLAGVYGMNFKHMPELGWRHGYPAFWFASLAAFVGLLFYFRRRGWLG